MFNMWKIRLFGITIILLMCTLFFFSQGGFGSDMTLTKLCLVLFLAYVGIIGCLNDPGDD